MLTYDSDLQILLYSDRVARLNNLLAILQVASK